MQEYNNFNYKIPYEVAHCASLNPLANFIFAEINGLIESKGQANISNQTLAYRWNRNTRTIIDSLKQLKEAKFITSQQIPNHRGRIFAVHNIPEKRIFLLIPNAIKVKGYDTKLLTLIDLLIYGYLYAEYSKQSKINDDKYLNEDIVIAVKNTDIASFINIDIKTVRRSLKKLASLNCISLTSTRGKGLEIVLNTELIINHHAILNLSTTMTTTLNKEPVNNRLPLLDLHFNNRAEITTLYNIMDFDRLPFNKLAIHFLYLNRTLTACLYNIMDFDRLPYWTLTAYLIPDLWTLTAYLNGHTPPTNRIFNRDILIDNRIEPKAKNQNNNILPISQNDIPPEKEQKNIQDEINELNKLDYQNSNLQSKEEKSEVKAMNENINNYVSGSSDIDNFLDSFYQKENNKPVFTQSSNQEPKQVATVQETTTAVKPTPVATIEPQTNNEASNGMDKYAQSIGYSNYAELVHYTVLGKHKQEKTAVEIKEVVQPVLNSSNKPSTSQRQFIIQVQIAQSKLTEQPKHVSDIEILNLMKQGYDAEQVANMIEAK